MTIPASDIVVVNPGVISSGGSPLALNGLILSKSAYLPTAAVQSFASAASVSNFFGPTSPEYAMAQVYFQGFDNSTIKPGALLFAPYVDTARAAWLQSGSLSGMTLTQLQALSGVLTITVSGAAKTSSTINLSAASSFSNAATIIQAGFTAPGFTVTWDPVKSAFIFTNTATGAASTITEATGTLSAGLKLTVALGALVSQGAAVDTPSGCMDNVKHLSQNWATFTTVWEPDLTNKPLFAAWASAQNSRFMYVCWDTDTNATVAGNTTCFGYLAKQAQYDGLMIVYSTKELAAFTMSVAASTDFSQTNGRATAAFKTQGGLTVTVSDQQIAANLLANGYSYYGSYATANQQFNILYNGQLPGKWLWFDTFIDQVRMNSDFQSALMNLLMSVKSIPYNEAGYALIRAAMLDPIQSALNFGSIRAGVNLSTSQEAQVNQAAGRIVSTTIEQQGYYLQVVDPGAAVRSVRGTPVINFWFTDGGAVQKITVASTDII